MSLKVGTPLKVGMPLKVGTPLKVGLPLKKETETLLFDQRSDFLLVTTQSISVRTLPMCLLSSILVD